MEPWFKTGIHNLDYLTGDGFRWVGDRPPAILVHGPPGAGKSVLCANIAANTFKRGKGKSVAYFILEQQAEDLVDLARKFQWWDENFKPAILKGDETANPTFALDKAVFAIFQYTAVLHETKITDPEPAAKKFMSFLERRLEPFKDRDLGLIVLDTLRDAVKEHAAAAGPILTFDARRSQFLQLCELGNPKKGCKAPILIALETTGEIEWRDYVADAVIQVGWERGDPVLPGRFVRIRKIRNQGLVE